MSTQPNAFENFIRELEKEGVGICTVSQPPRPGVQIFPREDRRHLDIAIPRSTPLYQRNYRNLTALEPLALPPLRTIQDLDGEVRNQVELIHGTVDIKVGSDEIEFNADNVPPVENLLSSLTQRVEKRVGLTGCFAQLYPKVRDYVRKRCFGGVVELDATAVRRALNHTGLLDAVAALFARRIAELTVESTPVKLSGKPYRLADTRPFLWRRMTTPAAKTIFNVVPCYNAFEARFADYLDRCDDIERFAALAEWFTHFHVQYLSRNGAIKLYYPDFVAVQITAQSPVNWMIET